MSYFLDAIIGKTDNVLNRIATVGSFHDISGYEGICCDKKFICRITNSWSLTPIGKIDNVDAEELREVPGTGDIPVIIVYVCTSKWVIAGVTEGQLKCRRKVRIFFNSECVILGANLQAEKGLLV